jgi:hypothetical protein
MVIYLFSTQGTRELVKICVLVDHYCDHKLENKTSGVLSFMIMHYFIEDGTDKDAGEDNQLPFKSLETTCTGSFLSLNPPTFIEIIIRAERAAHQSFVSHKDLFLPSQYLATVWRPPRYC